MKRYAGYMGLIVGGAISYQHLFHHLRGTNIDPNIQRTRQAYQTVLSGGTDQPPAAGAVAPAAAAQAVAEAKPAMPPLGAGPPYAPLLERFPAADGLAHAAAFLDWQASAQGWEQVSDRIAPGGTFIVNGMGNRPQGTPAADKAAAVAAAENQSPEVRLLRLGEKYLGAAPGLRVMGYFPGVTTSEVLHAVTDVTARRRHDRNYRHFADLTPFVDPAAAEARRARLLPRCRTYLPGDVNGGAGGEVGLVATQRAGLIRDACSVFRPLDWRLMSHAVLSPLMETLRVRPRMFAYERLVCGNGARDPSFSIVYRGVGPSADGASLALPGELPLKRARAAGAGAAPDAEAAEAGLRAALTDAWRHGTRCFMHYQEILLVPVYSRRDLSYKLHTLGAAGSLWDGDGRTSALIGGAASEGTAAAGKAQPLVQAESVAPMGVLMVATSANDPKSSLLPARLENKIASYIAVQSYKNMLVDIVQHRPAASGAATAAAASSASRP